MQVVYENERGGSQRANSVGAIIHAGGIGGYLEGEHVGRFEGGLLDYKTVGEFLAEIRKEFGGGEEELVKVAELRRLEQGGKKMKEFV